MRQDLLEKEEQDSFKAPSSWSSSRLEKQPTKKEIMKELMSMYAAQQNMTLMASNVTVNKMESPVDSSRLGNNTPVIDPVSANTPVIDLVSACTNEPTKSEMRCVHERVSSEDYPPKLLQADEVE